MDKREKLISEVMGIAQTMPEDKLDNFLRIVGALDDEERNEEKEAV
jgi:hypothetical protein